MAIIDPKTLITTAPIANDFAGNSDAYNKATQEYKETGSYAKPEAPQPVEVPKSVSVESGGGVPKIQPLTAVSVKPIQSPESRIV